MERYPLLEGRCSSVMALKCYLQYDCLQSHLDILDRKDDAEPMFHEVIGNVKMFLATKIISPMLNAGAGRTNGTTENVKYYLMQFCLI